MTDAKTDGATPAAEEPLQKLVMTGLFMDCLILIPETIAVIVTGSATFLADVIKVGNEMLATVFALLIIRRVTRGGKFSYDYGMGKFESLTRIITGAVMFVSLCILLVFTTMRLLHPEPFDMTAAIIGIPLMLIAATADSYHWRTYYRRAQREPSPIIEAQWRLRRAKTFSDLLILFALIVSVVFAPYHWAEYIDPIVSFIIIGFLLLAGYREISSSLPDLFDKTLEEELQILILRELAGSFDQYHEFHGVRSRRSGRRVYIEIFLGFDPDQRAGEIHEFAASLKESLESQIPHSVVSVVLSRG
ncbi:cation diffusion facilitator family transporter [Methanoregula sp.]|uniref:cation diffusion facilitator family transporter n=1 Tax=Methanoregula sp. TaxID=2052170 RepID=UPI000CCB1107|nr:cation transporter [Methanoregula sp.]PKG31237.1 MAG: cation transporter [Methanoregula sp.]